MSEKRLRFEGEWSLTKDLTMPKCPSAQCRNIQFFPDSRRGSDRGFPIWP